MSTAAASDRLEPAQHTAARIAGLMYIITIVSANFSQFYARSQLTTSERIFRLGTVSDLVTTAGVVILIVALYVVLRPVNRNVALLAAFFRLIESSIFAAITLTDFVALRLLSGATYLRAFDSQQSHALARLFDDVHADGYLIGLVFFGLGSTTFAYLWFKSRYIPRLLAGWGIFSSLLVAIVSLAIMAFPSLTNVLIPAYFAPIFIFEVTLGIWLLAKGIESPLPPSAAARP